MSHTVSWDGYTESYLEILELLEQGKITKITFYNPEQGNLDIFYTPTPSEPFCTTCAEDSDVTPNPSLPLSLHETQTLCEEHLWMQFENPDEEEITYTLK